MAGKKGEKRPCVAGRLLKRERLRRRTYKTRENARHDIFDYIEMFYTPKRKHAGNGMLPPVDFETRQRNVNQEGF
tara:strand:- start:1473 stop:1697 length:225 start_codon:yes stop_codon:yes gene_type:complete